MTPVTMPDAGKMPKDDRLIEWQKECEEKQRICERKKMAPR